MKLVSWNVNGIRAALKKGAKESLESLLPDVICLQEVRARENQFELALDGFNAHWNPAKRPGYSGTGILSKVPLLSVINGIGKAELDGEGRVITAELADFYLVTVYTPNSQRELARLDFRTKKWEPAFLAYLKKLEQKKPVVFCGDLNVAHREIDLANPSANRRNAGFTDEERAAFDGLLAAGFVDTFREFCAEGGHYTWWSNFGRAREKNVGWRIDYFVVSQSLRSRLSGAGIHPSITGSDHCPVSLELTLP